MQRVIELKPCCSLQNADVFADDPVYRQNRQHVSGRSCTRRLCAQPADFAPGIQRDGWYRIPARHMPKGLYANSILFRRKFDDDKWAIHFYACNLGHELTTRRDLLPDQPHHPRAADPYFKSELGPLLSWSGPIISGRCWRILSAHDLGSFFKTQLEIGDLTVDGERLLSTDFTPRCEDEPGLW